MKEETKIELSERDMMEDSLMTQKQTMAGYLSAVGESAGSQLRASLASILTEEIELSADIFTLMQSRGWYQPKQAQDSDIAKAKEKFSPDAN